MTCTIAYGSETGTAEEAAYRLWESLPRHASANIIPVDSIVFSELSGPQLFIFVVSTTGDGDVPGNMQLFWKYIRQRNLDGDYLSRMKFSVFGLGDSSYQKFNAAARYLICIPILCASILLIVYFNFRKLRVRLLQLGATEVYQMGLGDDQAAYGYLQMFDIWSRGLRDRLFGGIAVESDLVISLQSYTVEQIESPESSDIRQYFRTPTGCESTCFITTIGECKLLTAADWAREVVHVRLRISREHSALSYESGDVVAVQPANNKDLICRLLRILKHYEINDFVKIRRNSLKRESRVTDFDGSIEYLFKYILDIAGIPQRSFFKTIAPFAAAEDERQKLFELSDAVGTDLYYEYCIREKRNFVDVLEDFRSTHGKF
jgi:sulfite reductase alpha subunit-like flavoprotein